MSFDRIISISTGKTTYHDGDFAVKVFSPDYPKAIILNEATNQALMEDTSLYVPKVMEVCKTDDKWAILSEYIAGKNLQNLMQTEPEREAEFLTYFIDLQLSVFAEKGPLLNRIKDKVNRKIASSPLEATVRFELHARMEEIPKRHNICHGAFYPKNIIIREGKPYILNWAHATQGDPAADIANTYIYFCIHEKKELAEDYLRQICKRMELTAEDVMRWVPLVAAALSMDHRGEDQLKLLEFVDVADSRRGV